MGVDKRPAHSLEPGHRVAVDDVDPLGAVLAQERRPLVGALASADDQNAGAGEIVEAHELAGVRRPSRRKRGGPVRLLGVVADPRGADDGPGDDLVSPGERGLEPLVGLGERGDELVADIDALGPLEPLAVLEEDPDRDRVHGLPGDPMLLEVRPERVHTGCVEVPVRPRAQEHVGGHVLAPKPHRRADDGGVDGALARQRRGRQRVGSRTDNQKFADHTSPSRQPYTALR